MTNRIIIPLLCAASVVAFARGTTAHKSTLAASIPNNKTAEVTSLFTVNASHNVEFKLDVRNNTKKMVELRFPSGRTHDFIVQDERGVEVWRWSKSHLFTQGIQNKLVKAQDVTVFSEEWNPGKTLGKFTAIAVLASDNHPIEERVQFELK